MASTKVTVVLEHDRTTGNYERIASQDSPRDDKFKGKDKPFIAQFHVPKSVVNGSDVPPKIELEFDPATWSGSFRPAA